jgi:MoxR-like ATPase
LLDFSTHDLDAAELRRKALAVAGEVTKVIKGKDEVIAKVLLAVFARGHVLLEDVPGVGKTTMVVALAAAMRLDYRRIQFTPEVMPADVVGYSLYDRQAGTLTYQPGAALCNLLLVDEINRASSKTQSSLLQAMEENAVTVDGQTHRIDPPYTVIATQNPVGSAGTQLLPESQLDRFMVRLSLGYPGIDDEVAILKRPQGEDALRSVRQVADVSDVLLIQRQVEAVYVDEDLYRYIARLAAATREEPLLQTGASPRASLSLLQMARAAAWLAGRDYVVPKDVEAILFDVLEHRLSVGSQALVSDKTVHGILRDIVQATPRPQILREGYGGKKA